MIIPPFIRVYAFVTDQLGNPFGRVAASGACARLGVRVVHLLFGELFVGQLDRLGFFVPNFVFAKKYEVQLKFFFVSRTCKHLCWTSLSKEPIFLETSLSDDVLFGEGVAEELVPPAEMPQSTITRFLEPLTSWRFTIDIMLKFVHIIHSFTLLLSPI